MADPISWIVGLGGLAINGINAVNAHNAGQAAARKGDAFAERAEDFTRRQGDMALGTADYLRQQANRYSRPDIGNTLMDMGFDLGNQLRGIANTEARNIGSGDFASQIQALLGGAGRFDNYNFDPVRSVREQALAFADETGANARRDARAQMALAGSQQGSLLDAQLAQRGLSRDSGAASTALSQFALQNAAQTSQLESALAEQKGQLGMQGAQLDINSALQLAGMGSQYNLGMNQLRSQTGIQQAQGLAGLQALLDQQALQRAGLRSGALTEGFNAANAAYGQNFLNPMMNAQNLLGTIASYAGGYAQQGYGNILDMYGKGAQAAGSGKGAAMGGMSNFAMDLLKMLPVGGGVPLKPAVQPTGTPMFGVTYRNP